MSVSGEKVSMAVQTIDTTDQLSDSAKENLNRWLTSPQYEPYHARLVEMIEAGEFEALNTAFWEVIAFGTGGRRGIMGELGTATINERTIAESAHGLAAYMKQQKTEAAVDGFNGRAVIAHDTRNRSPEFARLTATTFAAHGLKVFFFDSHRSTPELSFAVRFLECDIGAMISASHNPPSDNGFKAYWNSGAQVLAPHDRGIINCVYEAGEIPTIDFDQAVSEGKIEIINEVVDVAYFSEVEKLSLSGERDMPAIFSPVHGVGETSVYDLLKQAGFASLTIYEPHREPNGNFPNVSEQLPNPERPEVFAPLIEEAKQTGAELLLASDPDADRLGVCVKDSVGEFHYITGNRTGALLTDYVLRKRVPELTAEHYVVETLVTSPLIAAIARGHKVRAIDDLLVGFKYIAETMDEQGPSHFVFGAEESLGYLAGEYARDKDATIAALYIMELAAELRKEQKTLLDRLDELFVEYGYHIEGQLAEYCHGPRGKEQIDGLMKAFRETPPEALGDLKLTRVRDYGQHEIRELPANKKTEELSKPDGNLLFFESAPNAENVTCSVAVRPSGTEPKIKFYFFAQAPCEDAGQLSQVKQQTDTAMQHAQDALSSWVQDVLKTV